MQAPQLDFTQQWCTWNLSTNDRHDRALAKQREGQEAVSRVRYSSVPIIGSNDMGIPNIFIFFPYREDLRGDCEEHTRVMLLPWVGNFLVFCCSLNVGQTLPLSATTDVIVTGCSRI